jgi:hypothetical protein
MARHEDIGSERLHGVHHSQVADVEEGADA